MSHLVYALGGFALGACVTYLITSRIAAKRLERGKAEGWVDGYFRAANIKHRDDQGRFSIKPKLAVAVPQDKPQPQSLGVN
jgi:hypothetical protein